MALFSTKFEVILASEEEVDIYYKKAAQQINLLLEKYDIRNINGQLEKVTLNSLKALLSFNGFFQATPLKSIFYDQKQSYVPEEVVTTFRNIISDAPLNIKAVFYNVFLKLLKQKGWSESLNQYFEQQYNLPVDRVITLVELNDFSLGFGVYRATFQFRNEEVVVFLKRAHDLRAYNELLYFQLQRKFLASSCHAKMPCLLSAEQNQEALLLSPLVPGLTSEMFISILTYTYKNTQSSEAKFTLQNALEILIESFMQHAALGDLLGRNDRHLLNSLIATVVNGKLQNTTLEDVLTLEQILAYANNIVAAKEKAISLIDIDLKWLLGEKNAEWALVDIDFGLSEINLLSLLPAFNDYSSNSDSFFAKRKDYTLRYFDVYCQTLQNILKKKELIYAAIQKIYPSDVAEQKLKLLTQRIYILEASLKPVIEIFKRYLLNYRMRLVCKETLFALYKIAKVSNNNLLFNTLRDADLLRHLSPDFMFDFSEGSVFLQLQCFRGVVSKKDSGIRISRNTEAWETVAKNISIVTKKFEPNLYKIFEDKKRFVKKDTITLIKLFLD